MKDHKAQDIDVITSEVLKSGGEPMVEMLYTILNAVYHTEKPPKNWAQILNTPIHNKDDRQKLENYRAISLLSIPGKVFSRILLKRMKKKTKEATGESQFCFRPEREREEL